MSSSRPNSNSDSTSGILACLECCACTLGTVAAASETNKAQDAHAKGNHCDEAAHYRSAANIRHSMGDHYSELRDQDKARHAEHEAHGHSNNTGCTIM